MLLPYFFDKIPETIGKVYAKICGWRPKAKRVFLKVTEGEPGLYGTIVSGTIIHTEETIKSFNPNLTSFWKDIGAFSLIKLDSPWHYNSNRELVTTIIVAVPRFKWHGIYRSILTSSIVNAFHIDSLELPPILEWKKMIAICEMTIEKE